MATRSLIVDIKLKTHIDVNQIIIIIWPRDRASISVQQLRIVYIYLKSVIKEMTPT
jgi:hypothetical protein